MHNSEIERIAMPDLSSETLSLLGTYGTNDDVVFFLGRLVWQGGMDSCADALAEIAVDPTRGRYARIAAIRGALAVGSTDQKNAVWEKIAGHAGPLDHAILAELLEWAETTTRDIELLLCTLEHVAPFEQFNTSGLDRAFRIFIDRLPVMADGADDHPLGRLVQGLNNFLEREPFIERRECHVSEEFAWLMPPALHAVDRLVSARSTQALTTASIAVMRNTPALRFWRGGDFDGYREALSTNVPRWHVLNDLLYWTSIADYRLRLERNGEQLIDDWKVASRGGFWSFGPEDFERCLEWVCTKESDDRIVALSRCIDLYVQADRPAAWLVQLRGVVADDEKLRAILEARIESKPSQVMEETDADDRRWKRNNEKRRRIEKKMRTDWVRALKDNPDRIVHPPGLNPGDLSNDQYHLLVSSMSSGVSTSREDGANWKALITEFGEPVARAYRDAAVTHWRAYWPELRSEGANTESTPYSLIFAMTGLAIEAAEDSAFAERLTPDEARLAFRYITWELNGFPTWFEQLYRTFPAIGREAVTKELTWELERSVAEHPLHYILHDVLYHAPWLHGEVSPLIFDWLRTIETANADRLRYCLNILVSGGIMTEGLAALAAEKAQNPRLTEQRSLWFAHWVDTDPRAAIPVLQSALEMQPPGDASDFALNFIVGLLGDRHGSGTRIGAYRNAQDLKALYILMHRYIRVAEDIDRANKGAYSPTLRDDAQEARNRLFKMLVETPGPEAYAAIKALGAEHPEPRYRRWMAAQARGRAAMDADEPLWTDMQVREFEQQILGT